MFNSHNVTLRQLTSYQGAVASETAFKKQIPNCDGHAVTSIGSDDRMFEDRVRMQRNCHSIFGCEKRLVHKSSAECHKKGGKTRMIWFEKVIVIN